MALLKCMCVVIGSLTRDVRSNQKLHFRSQSAQQRSLEYLQSLYLYLYMTGNFDVFINNVICSLLFTNNLKHKGQLYRHTIHNVLFNIPSYQSIEYRTVLLGGGEISNFGRALDYSNRILHNSPNYFCANSETEFQIKPEHPPHFVSGSLYTGHYVV
jgi:hypothetical protein